MRGASSPTRGTIRRAPVERDLLAKQSADELRRGSLEPFRIGKRKVATWPVACQRIFQSLRGCGLDFCPESAAGNPAAADRANVRPRMHTARRGQGPGGPLRGGW